ncbi:hypothetical protein IJI02_01100 [Candidatus Saccharibacteria bacterium]|nr:hypothetical protein [Candidatus Saccharibacteria bacterium]
MRRLKKQLLGLFGIIVVCAMTLVAYSIPSPGAGAVSSVTENLVVSVYDKNPSVKITSPNADDIILSSEPLTIEYEYSCASRIEFVLQRKDPETGEWVDYELWTDDFGHLDIEDLETHTGSHTLQHFDELAYGEYILSYKAFGGTDTLVFEDSIEFAHYAVRVVYIGTNENNEPVFDIYYNTDAFQIDFQIYDENGDPMFDPNLIYPGDDSRYIQIEPEGDF